MSGTFDQNFIKNADQSHFIVNLNNGRTLDILGDTRVGYADAKSNEELESMMVRITGGGDACNEPSFSIFK